MTVLFFPLPKYSKSDMEFLEECAKLRDSNSGSPIVSKGGKDEFDYDELKEIPLDDTTSFGWQLIEQEQPEKRKAVRKYVKKPQQLDLKELVKIAKNRKKKSKKQEIIT